MLMLKSLFLAGAFALIASPALADPDKDESGKGSYRIWDRRDGDGIAIGESATGIITDATPTAFPVGICRRRDAAVCGSTTARLAISLRRRVAGRRSDWLTEMAAG
jgi:hypothetical protein